MNNILTMQRKINPKQESLFIGIIVLFAILVRLFTMYFRGSFLEYDETYYILLARNLLAGSGYSLNGLPHINNFPFLPIVIAGFSFIIPSLLWASRMITIIAGGVLLIPLYFLIKQIAGRTKIAFVAIITVTIIPPLSDFANPGTKYLERIFFGSEHLFILLIFGGCYCIWLASKQGRVIFTIAGGIIFGFSYLTRFEGMLYFFVTALWLLFSLAHRRKFPLKKAVGLSAVCIFAFLLTISPLIGYLYQKTGNFTVSGKIENYFRVKDSMRQILVNDDPWPFCRTLYALDESAKKMKSQLWGIEKADNLVRINDEGSFFKEALRSLPFNFHFFLTKGLPIIFPIIWLWPFGVIGIFCVIRRPSRWLDKIFLPVTVLLPTLAIILFSLPLPKYCLLLIPLISYYIAEGVIFIGEAIDKKTKILRNAGISIVVFLVLGSVITGVHSLIISTSKGIVSFSFHKDYLRKRIGLQLKERTLSSDIIMSWHPSIAFFADRDWRVLPVAPFDELVSYALHKKVNYIVFSRLSGHGPKQVWEFFAGNNELLFLILDIRETGGPYLENYRRHEAGEFYMILGNYEKKT